MEQNQRPNNEILLSSAPQFRLSHLFLKLSVWCTAQLKHIATSLLYINTFLALFFSIIINLISACDKTNFIAGRHYETSPTIKYTESPFWTYIVNMRQISHVTLLAATIITLRFSYFYESFFFNWIFCRHFWNAKSSNNFVNNSNLREVVVKGSKQW